MTTLEEVRKAYEDLSEEDKKAFSQSIQDRVDESLGEQEKEDGTEDSQTAKDREDEALGEEHAEGKGDVEELHETDEGEVKHEEEQEDKHEKSAEKDAEHDDRISKIESDIAEIKEMLSKKSREPEKADKTTAEKLSELERKYE